MVNKFFRAIMPILTIGIMACSNDDEAKAPEVPQKNKTVLFYVESDINLWYMLDESLNEIEAGWEDGTDGNLIVYLDKSPYLTQFSSPVLLKIRHDETDRIVSEVIKHYPEQDSGDPEVVRRVLSEVIELFPAKTHGLAFAAHGNGWIPGNARELINGDTGNHEHKTRHLAGPERYGSSLEIDELARILPIKYEFILFHACMMANVETAYALKDKCDYLIGTSQGLPGPGLPYAEVVPYLFTSPHADWYKFLRTSLNCYDEMERYQQPLTLSLIQTNLLDELAEKTRKVMTSLAGDLPKFYRNLSDKVYHYEGDGAFSDLRQIIELQCDDPDNPSEEIAAFFDAINRAVPLKGATEKHWADKEEMLLSPEDFCGLSCYVPQQNSRLDRFQEYYRTHYKWAEASGFDLLIAK